LTALRWRCASVTVRSTACGATVAGAAAANDQFDGVIAIEIAIDGAGWAACVPAAYASVAPYVAAPISRAEASNDVIATHWVAGNNVVLVKRTTPFVRARAECLRPSGRLPTLGEPCK
jgi:hypothetical protein